MKIRFFKTPIALVVALFTIFILSGCQEKPPAESQIILDMPGELTEIFVDDVPIGMSIDNIEITRRQTNDKDDTVFFTYVMSGGPYRVTGSYRFDYVYYDQGGWILEDYTMDSDPEITLITNDSLTDLFTSMEEFCCVKLSDYDEINCVDHWNDTQSLHFIYEVSRTEPYLILSGPIECTYTLQNNLGLSFYWKPSSDTSQLIDNWDLVGTYEWRYAEKEDNLIVVIDSYDPVEQSVHISSAKFVTPTFSLFGNSKNKSWNDLTVYLEASDFLGRELSGTAEDLRLIFYYDHDPTFFVGEGYNTSLRYMTRISS